MTFSVPLSSGGIECLEPSVAGRLLIEGFFVDALTPVATLKAGLLALA